MSDLSDSLTVTHLSWTIWANCSQSLIWFEQNEQMSDERMSDFPALHKNLNSSSWNLTIVGRSQQTTMQIFYGKNYNLANSFYRMTNSSGPLCTPCYSNATCSLLEDGIHVTIYFVLLLAAVLMAGILQLFYRRQPHYQAGVKQKEHKGGTLYCS